MSSSNKLQCSRHHNKYIKRVTFDSNPSIKTKLMCDDCQQQYSLLQTNVKFDSFLNLFQKYKPTLVSVSLLDVEKQIGQLLTQIMQFKHYLQKCIMLNLDQKKTSNQYYQEILSNLIWPYIAKKDSKCPQQQGQINYQISETKLAINQVCEKLIISFKRTIAKEIQSFKSNLQLLKKKSFNQIKNLSLNILQQAQMSAKRRHDFDQQQCTRQKIKQIKKNQPQFRQQKIENNKQQKNADSNKQTCHNIDTKTNKEHIIAQSSTIILPKQIKIPFQSKFISNFTIRALKQPHIVSYKDQQNTGFILAEPNFSRDFNSRIFKIQKFGKGSQIYIGAALKQKNCFGFGQGTFLIKGSSSLANITFISHQFKRSMDLRNYSIQENYFIQVKLNCQKLALDFCVIKPMFRHLGTMMFKNYKAQDLYPVIGIKGDASVKIIQKQIIYNKQIETQMKPE